MTKKEATDNILTVAAGLFRRRGFAGTPIRDVATSAGILPGSLHYRFPSKESLLLAVTVRGLEQAIAEVRSAITETSDPVKAIRNAIRVHVRLLVDGDDTACVALYDFRSLSGNDRASVIALRDAYEGLWNGLLHSAAGAGFVRPDVDLALTRHMLLGAINWTAQWYRTDGHLSVDDIADRLVDTLFRGVLP